METIAFTVAGVTTEVSFTVLGVGPKPVVTFGTHGASRFTLPLPGIPPETTALIPFEAPCVVYTGRSVAAGAFSGGSILFQGRRTDKDGSVSGSGVSTTLVIEDAWYDLRLLTFQNSWQIITGGTVTNPTYGTSTWPDTVLFQAAPTKTYTPAAVSQHITTGQAIVEIVQYAISCGVNLQIGQIDPALYVPFYPIRSLRCADALKIALRVHPDCTTEIDYTTTPPTFNVRQRSNLTALTLPYKGSSPVGGATRTHITSQVKPRPDLQVTRVGIYIKAVGAVGSQQVVTISTDIYPAGVASGLRSFDTSLDMSGPKFSMVTGQVTATAAAFTTLPWWQLKVPALNQPETVPGSLALVNTAINDGSKNCLTIVDESGNPISLATYPSVMEHEGTIHPWMPVTSIKAIVTGYFTYQRRKNIGTAAAPIWVTTKTPNAHAHPVRVHLTNSPAGTTPYYLQQTISTGEIYIAGFAQGIYTALQQLQYQFSHTIMEQPFTTILKPGKHALNVTGGAAAWTAMNAMVQEVTIEFINSPATGLTSAKTTIRCGPVAHLEPGQLVQLFNVFQNRDLSKINPNERTSGLPNGGANAAMPSETAKENSTQGEPDEGQQMFSAADSVTPSTLTTAILHDPANGQINVQTFQNTSAAPAGTGLIAPTFFGNGVPATGTLPANVNFRLNWRYLDAAGNAEYYCSTAGTNSTSVWKQLSGGASGGAVWI